LCLKNTYKFIVVKGKSLHSQSDKDLCLSKDLNILKYSVPDFVDENQELMKKFVTEIC
jgi:hypothetical protein|tara:strand:+ start:677 stop:850 length:174 start_codon:yes stop_codon:yes gene_type:complete